jgi:hypothetical protein
VRDLVEKKLVQEQRRRRWIRRVADVVGVLVLAVVTVVGVGVATHTSPPIRVLPAAKFALPPETSECRGAVSLGDGAVRLPITVSHSGSPARMYVDVCLDGQGPLPFIIDTGAATSLVDVRVADRLQLPKVGSPRRYAGVGCTVTTQLKGLLSWNVEGMPLAAQTVAVLGIPGFGRAGEPAGLLGSDVLGRFGAVRFDFAAQTMTVPGPEGPPPSTEKTVNGPFPIPIPSVLVTGPPGSIVGLGLIDAPTYVIVTTSVQFKGVFGTVAFAVDTGSSSSLVDTFVLPALNLAKTNFIDRTITVCSWISVPFVHSGRWSVGNVQLPPMTIASTNLGTLGRSGISGLLGLDEMSRFRYVIFDYAGAKLAFGPRLR